MEVTVPVLVEPYGVFNPDQVRKLNVQLELGLFQRHMEGEMRVEE